MEQNNWVGKDFLLIYEVLNEFQLKGFSIAKYDIFTYVLVKDQTLASITIKPTDHHMMDIEAQCSQEEWFNSIFIEVMKNASEKVNFTFMEE